MSTIDTWKPYEKYVQANLVGGQFLSAAFTLIAAGPPRLANVGGAGGLGSLLASGGASEIALPIGIVQNFNLGQNQQIQQIFEIGSERSYLLGGRVMKQFSLSRVLYHGPSLLRMLYAYYSDELPPTYVDVLFPNLGATTMPNPHNVKVPPGYENLFLNLASDLFKQPIGLLLYFKDSNEDTVGSFYLENCLVPNHTLATDSNGVIIQESSALQFERVRPVAVSSLALVRTQIDALLGAPA